MDSNFWQDPINSDHEQVKRIVFSQRIKTNKITIDPEKQTAIIIGSEGTYNVTLNQCNCFDYETRKLPCKHMYRLMHELGKFDLPKTNREAVKAFKESIPETIEHYKNLYLSGAIPGEKFVKIVNALQSK